LLADEPLASAFPRRPLRLHDRRHWEGGVTDIADLAGVDKVGEGAEGLVDVGVRVVAVDLVKVDPVGPQPPQRIIDLAHDPAPRVAAVVGIPPIGMCTLVASTTSSCLPPASASPTMTSDSPCE